MALDDIFLIKKRCELIRVGQKNDGGYLICKKSLLETRYLISIGISDDFSFEDEFLKIKNGEVDIRCYDDVLSNVFLLKKLIMSFLRMLYRRDLRIFNLQLKKSINYLKLNKKIIFTKKKIQQGDLDNILKQINSDKVYLKIDIEGGEYDLLDEVLNHQKKLNGLIIEFHDCNLHKKQIKEFIENLKIPLVHLHGNNFAPLDEEQNPTVLEVTFDKSSEKFNGIIKLPNILDMPNDPNQNEILIKYKKIN